MRESACAWAGGGWGVLEGAERGRAYLVSDTDTLQGPVMHFPCFPAAEVEGGEEVTDIYLKVNTSACSPRMNQK